MSTCDACTSPGNCCRGFVLSLTVPLVTWQEDAQRIVDEYDLPFVAVRAAPWRCSEPETHVAFDCTRLGSDGRCSDYESRPMLCREYKPASDPLCAMHLHELKGIPIRVQHGPAR